MVQSIMYAVKCNIVNSSYQTNIVQVNRACRPVSKPVDYNVQWYNKSKWKSRNIVGNRLVIRWLWVGYSGIGPTLLGKHCSMCHSDVGSMSPASS